MSEVADVRVPAGGVPGGGRAITSLLGGDTPIITVGGPSVIAARLGGSDVIITAHIFDTILYSLMVAPEIRTMADLKEHAELMKKFPDMEHEEAHMAHVGPGKSGDIVWRFNRPGTFYFACLIAGHFEAGMVGTVSVQ